ncbi:MAG TPA: hypothetical protein VD886_02320, partial [Herpetosiphonaceae bacterium]|nr:hypothetical protein [Herpetosiphonaceae bacterium]
TDTDNDGLTDAIEQMIGTAPAEADSDGDSISDRQEAQGFGYNSGTWYLDPLAVDSNNDGIDDLREWRRDGNLNATPQDSDGDNTPDLFDLDNDNDGVNDRYDLSPFSTADGFGRERPFSFRLPDLQAGKLSYVEFQVRPTDSRHLWYALNVLDWPQDKRGQIQDSDGKTFADTGDTSVPNTRNGDLKLLPMLEIRMDADNANQADPTSELQPYGITIRDYDQARTTRVAYVPLTLQTDEEESRIAFNGKMIYKASGSWTKPHSVRMVWMVQALVDKCGDTAIKNDADCKTYRSLNQPEIVQIYPEESWALAGMNVQEQHGTDIALAYEAPALDPARNDDTPLVALANGLERSFLVGRDENRNDKRDLAVKDGGDTSLAARFGAGSPAGEQRWSLPGHLRVETFSYGHGDQGLRDITSVRSKAVLAQYQTTAKPLFLFAREYRFRSTNMDTHGLNATAWENQSQLALAMNPRNEAQEVQTLASVNIAPYCHQGGAWQACSPTDYLAILDERLAPYVYQSDNRAQGWGEATIAEMYHLALQRGLSNVVQSGSLPLPSGFELNTDRLLTALIGQGLVQGGLWVAGQVTGSSAVIPNPQALTQSIGNIRLNSNAGISDLSRVGARIKGLSSSGKSKSSLGGVAVLLALPVLALGAGAGLGVLGSVNLGGNPLAMQIVTGIFDIGVPALGALLTVFDFIKSFSSVKGPVAAVSKVTSVVTSGAFIATLGLLFELGTTWGLFIFQVASAGVPPGSPEFTVALSQTISATILAVILFAVGLAGGVGALLIAFASLADGIIKVVCNATGSTNSVCKGILGTLTDDINRQVDKLFGKLLLFPPSLIDIKPGTPILTFANPERGLTAGNRLIVS